MIKGRKKKKVKKGNVCTAGTKILWAILWIFMCICSPLAVPVCSSPWTPLSTISPAQEEAEPDFPSKHISWSPMSTSKGAVAHSKTHLGGPTGVLGASSCRPSRCWTSMSRQRNQTSRAVSPIRAGSWEPFFRQWKQLVFPGCFIWPSSNLGWGETPSGSACFSQKGTSANTLGCRL